LAQQTASANELQQMQLSAAEQRALMTNLSTQQAQAAETAKAQLAQQQEQYAEQKTLMLEQQAAQAKALEEERRTTAQRESARLTASRRSGRRSLLSEARLNPEAGLVPGYGDVTRSI